MPDRDPTLRLRKPVEAHVRAGHPWIFRDALEPHTLAAGRVATVVDRRGRFVARGLVEQGAIGLRVWRTDDAPLDRALVARRLEEALARRDALDLPETDALRLVHGEGDRLPGVVLDRYADCAVLKLDGAAAAAWRDALVRALRPLLAERGVRTLLERQGRGEAKRGVALLGELPAAPVAVRELGMRLWADLVQGQKTGLFLDHRDSRRRVRALGAAQVLNLYGYTGAFSVAAGLGGARRVITVDSAAPAVAAAAQNWALNGLPPGAHQGVSAPVERYLRQARARFDLVIADPPSFAPSQAAVPRALAAYRALHRAALQRVRPGGLYLAASCSSHVSPRRFGESLRQGARDAGRRARVLERWGAAADHPVLAAFPEGAYLKVLLVEVA